jgi:hypothetical protein
MYSYEFLICYSSLSLRGAQGVRGQNVKRPLQFHDTTCDRAWISANNFLSPPRLSSSMTRGKPLSDDLRGAILNMARSLDIPDVVTQVARSEQFSMFLRITGLCANIYSWKCVGQRGEWGTNQLRHAPMSIHQLALEHDLRHCRLVPPKVWSDQ